MIAKRSRENYQYRCCKSENIRKNGYNSSGSLQYYCGVYKILYPRQKYSAERKEDLIKSYYECGSMRGISRIFEVSPLTLSSWLKKKQKKLR